MSMNFMNNWQGDFGPFDGDVWLNCAHQGPVPRSAVDAIEDATFLKRAPHRLTDQAFWEVPDRLKRALGALINASPDEIILGNSFSYGLHQLIRGIDWNDGDEVLLVEGDFPATVLPWYLLKEQGVRLKFIDPDAATGLAQQISDAVTDQTRVFSATWVDSFTGRRLDIDSIGEVCHAQDVLFILNGSQGVGARPIDVANTPVDVLISCGYKWLCGPYGTGFMWLAPKILESLSPVQANWLAMQAGASLDETQNLSLRTDLGTSGFDVFGTANFNNFMPWSAAVEYLNDIGVDSIADHGEQLVNRLIEGIETSSFDVLTPIAPDRHANIVVLHHPGKGVAQEAHHMLSQNGFHTALREGNLRVSPHLYNTVGEIDELVDILTDIAQ